MAPLKDTERPPRLSTLRRPARADAVRNRIRILAAAEACFASRGLQVPLDEIAANAGVGPGTLHRHYPTKELLFEAVVAQRIAQLTQKARELARADDHGAAFVSFFEEMVDAAAQNKAIGDALVASGAQLSRRVLASKRQLTAALATLLRDAQKQRKIRADIEVEDVSGLVLGCLQGPGASSSAARRRIFSVVVDGLRTRRSSIRPHSA
jgi:AcrR family transcriptional regulator